MPANCCCKVEAEEETPNDSLPSGIEAAERLLRIVDQRASKFRKYYSMLISLKNDLLRAMHDRRDSQFET